MSLTQEDMTKMYGVMQLIVGDNRPINKLRPTIDTKARFKDAVIFIDSISVIVEHGGRRPFFDIALIQYASDKNISTVLNLIDGWIKSKLSPYDFLPGYLTTVPANLKEWSRMVV